MDYPLWEFNGLSIQDVLAVLDIDILICKLQLRIQLLMEEEKARRERERQELQKTRIWVKEYLKRREELGMYSRLMEELKCEDEAGFQNFLRFPVVLFHELLEATTPRIQKQDTFFRRALPAGLKLAFTLRYLATGNTYQDIHYGFRCGANTISLAVPEVCQALLDEFAEEYMSCPIEEEQWLKIAEEFNRRWNLPHCCGALDGKHVAIKKPKNTGSVYFNYKGFFSLVLMALVDANYRFLYATCGDYGSISDGGIFERTDLKAALRDNSINLPPPSPIVPGQRPVPYYIVADEAFPLQIWLMKPLPQRNMTREQRIFNYRLSRARRVVENAFGVLAARFRCLFTTMGQKTDTITTIVLTCCLLHNMLITKKIQAIGEEITVDQEVGEDHVRIPGSWRNEQTLQDMGTQRPRVRYGNKEAKELREYLVQYVNSPEGSVPWQDSRI